MSSWNKRMIFKPLACFIIGHLCDNSMQKWPDDVQNLTWPIVLYHKRGDLMFKSSYLSVFCGDSNFRSCIDFCHKRTYNNVQSNLFQLHVMKSDKSHCSVLSWSSMRILEPFSDAKQSREILLRSGYGRRLIKMEPRYCGLHGLH